MWRDFVTEGESEGRGRLYKMLKCKIRNHKELRKIQWQRKVLEAVLEQKMAREM